MVAHPISSMTGFARIDGEAVGARYTWEIKSVNGRGLEQRFRTPAGLDRVEPGARSQIADRLARGNVNCILTVEVAPGVSTFRVNAAALTAAIAAVQDVKSWIDCSQPSAEAILGLRGVLEPNPGPEDEDAAVLDTAILSSLGDAITKLIEVRVEEGAKLLAAITGLLDEVEALTAAARDHAEADPQAIKERLNRQLNELLSGGEIPDDRLAIEAAALAVKADIREELDRLTAHIEAARDLLKAGGPIGRRLDFLAQEFNREANTLCAKAHGLELKRIGLDLKAAIDRIREQAQNVE